MAKQEIQALTDASEMTKQMTNASIRYLKNKLFHTYNTVLYFKRPQKQLAGSTERVSDYTKYYIFIVK